MVPLLLYQPCPLPRIVTTHHRRHDGCVDDPEVLDADDAALLVDDGGRVGGRAHLARARRVVRGVRLGPGLGLGKISECDIQVDPSDWHMG